MYKDGNKIYRVKYLLNLMTLRKNKTNLQVIITYVSTHRGGFLFFCFFK